jgi:hypothetical protein
MVQTLVLVVLFFGSWSVAVAGKGGPVEHCCNYRIPAGFVYEGESLTLEQARELPGRNAVLTLLGVTEITPEVARLIVSPHEDTFLTLPALETVDVAAADALSRHRGDLRLWGIKSLTSEVAEALSKRPGQSLELIGVRDLPPDVARSLANGKRQALAVGLTSLSAEIAEVLADFNGDLRFPRLQTLALDAATALGSHRGQLDLGPAHITPDVAEVLLRHDAPIGLTGVKRLASGVGDILARHKAEVWLLLEEIDSATLARKLFTESTAPSSVCNLRTMSPDVAAEYARRPVGFYLERLDTLSVEAARELAKGSLEIKLPAVTKLSPDLATALTDRTPSVYLQGIKALDGPDAVPVAEALASTPAPIWMDSLERVSAPALAALRKKDTITLPPDEKLTIVP